MQKTKVSLEVAFECEMLFTANVQAVSKGCSLMSEVWERIIGNIIACSVARLSPQKCRDGWRALKGAVLNHPDRLTICI